MNHRAPVLIATGFLLASSLTFAKKKDKPVMPDLVLKAQTVLVLIQPDTAEPLGDPTANRRAQEDVDKALMKWGRFRPALNVDTADIVITVRKGTDKAASPTISGGPIDRSPGSVESTDSQISITAAKGRPPDASQNNDPIAQQQDQRTHTGAEVGSSDDFFRVYQGGVQYPLDRPPIWSYSAKHGLRPPDMTAVAEFRKAIEEAEQVAKKKQQQSQPQPSPPRNP